MEAGKRVLMAGLSPGGITVLQYSPYNSGGSMGVTIALGYTDGGSGFRNFNWVQKITTNQPLGGARSPYNDPQPPDDNLPFYWTNSELPSHTNQGGFNSIFSDRPTRDANGGDTYWQSTLTVAGVIGNTYYPIINISYGFQIHNGQLTLNPITYSTPLNNSVTFSPFFPEKY